MIEENGPDRPRPALLIRKIEEQSARSNRQIVIDGPRIGEICRDTSHLTPFTIGKASREDFHASLERAIRTKSDSVWPTLGKPPAPIPWSARDDGC